MKELSEKAREFRANILRVAQEAPEDLLHMRTVVHNAPCGTARCLLGWMLVDPWFVKNSPTIATLTPTSQGSGAIPYSATAERVAREAEADADTVHRLFGAYESTLWLNAQENPEECSMDSSDATFNEHAIPKANVVKNAIAFAEARDDDVRCYSEF